MKKRTLGILLALLLALLPGMAAATVINSIPKGTQAGQIPVWSMTANNGLGGYALSTFMGVQPANLIFASPDGTAGTPGYRKMVSGDLPAVLDTPWWQYVPAGGSTSSEGYQYICAKTAPEFSGTQDLYIYGGSRLHLGARNAMVFDCSALSYPNGFSVGYSSPNFFGCNNFTVGSDLNDTTLFKTGSNQDSVFQPYGPSYAIVIKENSGQTRNPEEVQSSTGTVLQNITPAGVENAQGFSTAGTSGLTVTVPLAKLTSSGANGSETFTGGILTAETPPS